LSKKDTPILNEDIRFPEVRCIGDDGSQYGIISSREAYDIAKDEGVDLVLIAPDAKPPVVKVMDYNKFKYQQEKKLKEAKKKQKLVEVKEIKLSCKIAQNDLNYKVKHAIEFLEDEKHVKFRVFLKGREIAEPESGVAVLNRVWEMVSEYGVKDKEPLLEGRHVNMMVLPKKKDEKKK
jgi:translation initiation factor IF-3